VDVQRQYQQQVKEQLQLEIIQLLINTTSVVYWLSPQHEGMRIGASRNFC